jgi:hypothetical protein
MGLVKKLVLSILFFIMGFSTIVSIAINMGLSLIILLIASLIMLNVCKEDAATLMLSLTSGMVFGFFYTLTVFTKPFFN